MLESRSVRNPLPSPVYRSPAVRALENTGRTGSAKLTYPPAQSSVNEESTVTLENLCRELSYAEPQYAIEDAERKEFVKAVVTIRDGQGKAVVVEQGIPADDSHRAKQLAAAKVIHVLKDKKQHSEQMSADQSAEDEIINERLYEILVEYPRGATAKLASEIYEQKFGERLMEGWVMQLPDEFEVCHPTPTLTMLYVKAREPAPEKPPEAPAAPTEPLHVEVEEQHPTPPPTSPQVEQEQPAGILRAEPNKISSIKKSVLDGVLFQDEIDEMTISQHSSVAGDGAWEDLRVARAQMSAQQLTELLESGSMPVKGRTVVSVTCCHKATLDFFVRLSDKENEEKYKRMKAEIDENYGDGVQENDPDSKINRPVPKDRVVYDGFYIARYKDGWHRCIVIDDNSVESSSVVSVFLLDVGEIAALSICQLRFCFLLDLVDFPVFSLRCQLSDVFPTEPIVKEFERLMAVEEMFSLELVSQEKPENGGVIHYVKLFDGNGRNLNEYLNALEEQGSESTVTSTPQIEPKQVSEMNGFSAADEEQRVSPKQALVPFDLPSSSDFLATVVFAPDPSEFSIQLHSIQPLPELLQDMMGRELAEATPIEDDPVPGQIYAAKVQNRWQRVHLGPERTAKGSTRRRYGVFLVDCGHFCSVFKSDLYEMTPPLYIPNFMMAIKCELVGVKPKYPDRFWSEAAQEAFNDKVMGPETNGVKVQVVGEPSSWSAEHAPGLPKVRATLADAKTGEDIGGWLVEEGYADATDM